MRSGDQSLHVLLARLDNAAQAPDGSQHRVTQKDLAIILRCDACTISSWLSRLEISLKNPYQCASEHPARFLIESWNYCRGLRFVPFAKTRSVASLLGLYQSTVPRIAKQLGLKPIILRHPRLRFPIHFWTFAQVKRIAVHVGRPHLMTTNKIFPTRFSSSRAASTAQRPRVWRSRHRHTRNFPTQYDDRKS